MVHRHSLISATAFVALVTASSAFAGDLCAGIGSGGEWIGGTEAASDIATATTYQEQMALLMAGGKQVSLFSLSGDSSVRIEAAARGIGDPLIEVYDSAGNMIASDDDSGGNGASLVELDLQAGQYCVSTQSYDNGPLTGTVRVGLLEHEAMTTGMDDLYLDDSDMACTSDTDAMALVLGEPVTTTVDDSRFWRFTLDTPLAVTIQAANEDADPMLSLYDSFGGLLGENDDYDGLNAQIDMASPLSAGDYCVALGALSDTTLPITLSLTEYDPQAALLMMFDNGEAAPPLDGSYPITPLGTAETRLRQDVVLEGKARWLSFDVNDAGLIVVEAIAVGGSDPQIVLFDDLGRELAFNDDASTSYDSLLAARVNPGTYLLAVMDVNESAQSSVRVLVERFVPAR